MLNRIPIKPDLKVLLYRILKAVQAMSPAVIRKEVKASAAAEMKMERMVKGVQDLTAAMTTDVPVTMGKHIRADVKEAEDKEVVVAKPMERIAGSDKSWL
jgi:hypothetical protein